MIGRPLRSRARGSATPPTVCPDVPAGRLLVDEPPDPDVPDDPERLVAVPVLDPEVDGVLLPDEVEPEEELPEPEDVELPEDELP